MQKLIELSMNITTNKKENKSGEKGGESMTNKEMLGNVVLELYSQITKELKEKGLTEEVLNAIKILTDLLTNMYYL